MGQYHIIHAPELKQSIYPFEVNSGLKAIEQIWSWGPRATFTLLMATGFGQGPRALDWAEGVGAWAGRRISAAGDYAEDTDMLNAPVFLENDSCHGNTKPVNKTSTRKVNKSVASHFIPVLERVGNCRRSNVGVNGVAPKEKYSFWSFVDVKKTQYGWGISATDQQTRDYFERVATKNEDGTYLCARAPITLDGAPDVLPEKPCHTPGLWVNLDREEYIDATAFGENDLVDIANGMSGGAVMAMLFHHDSRGGGDLHGFQHFHIAGRWRGDRIVLMGPEGIQRRWAKMDPETVKANFTDITDLTKFFIEADEFTNERDIETHDGVDMTPKDNVQAELTKILLLDADIRGLLLDMKESFHVSICGPATLSMGSKTFDIAPSVRVHTLGGGRLWIPKDMEAQFKTVLADLTTSTLIVNQEKEVQMDNAAEFEISAMSAHSVLQQIT